MSIGHICDRCKDPKPKSLQMSKFNTEMLCPKCLKKEKEHPMYEKAAEAERNAVLNGDYNFPGIGKPADLI